MLGLPASEDGPLPLTEVFCDFDGTITKHDVLDAFLGAFAGPEWLGIEARWRNGEIGSRECLERQLRCVPPVSQAEMDGFLDGVEIDPHFLEFMRRARAGKFTILSDGFDFFIKSVLARHEIHGVRFFSNKLVWSPGQAPRAEFPHMDPLCQAEAGACKCRLVEACAPGRKFLYIGDGQSDFCVSSKAELVAAKGKLARYCLEKRIPFFEFRSFQDINQYFEKDGSGVVHAK